MSHHIHARAVVTLTVEVEPDDRWGADCSIAQAQKQGIESALSVLGHLVSQNPRVRIVGRPDVRVVAFEADKKDR